MVNRPNPKLSIIISVFGQADKLKRCLSCVEKTLSNQFDYEVLILDDASEDHTTDYINSLQKKYRVFLNPKRLGFAKNNNFLAQKAKGDYLCLLNSDAYVQGDWLTPMINALESDCMVGIVGNVQKLADSIFYDHMGVVFGPMANPRHFGQGFLFNPFKGKVKEWTAVTAACSLVRKSTFLSFDGFDESFINGCEDVELCIRMARSGYRHLVAHDSVIQHVKGASDGRKKYNQQNFEILIEKWGKSICSLESVQDQKKHAFSYLYQCLINPYRADFFKLKMAMSMLLGLRKLTTPLLQLEKPTVVVPNIN
jgi:GT2 family glycosyltransferase